MNCRHVVVADGFQDGVGTHVEPQLLDQDTITSALTAIGNSSKDLTVP